MLPPGKIRRFKFLCETLGLTEARVQDVRYQLLHRTTSAVIEAKRFNAKSAVMLVHSFSRTKDWFEDYRRFAGLFGVNAEPDRLCQVDQVRSAGVYLGRVSDSGMFGQEKDEGEANSGTVVARECGCYGRHEIGVESEGGSYTQLKPGVRVRVGSK